MSCRGMPNNRRCATRLTLAQTGVIDTVGVEDCRRRHFNTTHVMKANIIAAC